MSVTNLVIITPFLLFAISGAGLVQAQPNVILFENIFSGKHVELKTGDAVHLRFTVNDTADAHLDIAISDVTVTGTIESIGATSVLLVTKNKTFDRVSVIVPVNSIHSFRKYSPLRPVLKAASVIVSAAAGMLATLQISNSDDILSFQNAGLAVGTTCAAYMAHKIFSDKMKFYSAEGWRGKVVTRN